MRELQHSIEKAVIMADGAVLSASSFQFINDTMTDQSLNLQNTTIEEMEKAMILASIKNEKGNMSAVAKTSGNHPSNTLQQIKEI